MDLNRTRSGFTLVELLVVIAIVAIISAIAVSLTAGLTTRSAIAATYATEKQLTNQMNQYVLAHDRLMPDGFDSMIRDDWSTVSSAFGASFVANTYNQQLLQKASTMVRGFMYAGYDPNQDGYAESNAVAKGMTVLACGSGVQTLTVAKLRSSDVTALNQIGITTVYDIRHDVDATNGVYTYVKRTLATGDPAFALDPTKAFGTVPTYATFNNFSSVTNLYLVFGIGPQCKAIGDRRGGLQEVPVCSTIVTGTSDEPRPRTDYYNRFMVVVKMPIDSMDRPSFAGILDSQGWNTQASKQWYWRFSE